MKKQFICLTKSLIVFLMVFFSSHQLFAQAQGSWVVKKMPDVLPTSWYRAVGENCLIYVGKNDSVIYAYDLNSSEWHEHTQHTELPWQYYAAAGKNVAFVYTDSIVTAYSAVMQSFKTLSYAGTLLGIDVKISGCVENVAYFVTEQYFYVFDAENSQWYSHQISGFGSIDKKYVYEKPGYLLVKLYDTSGNEKLISYSISTKNFFELNYSFSTSLETLDYGYIVWDNSLNLPEDEKFFGGYSAIHNTWTEYHKSEYFVTGTTSDAKYLYPRTVFMFRVSTPLADPNYRHTFYLFNTLYSDAVIVSRDTNDDYTMHDTWTGSQTATIAFMNVNDNTLEILAYRSDTHSMTPFLTTPLHFEGMWRPYSCGGKMYLAWDLHYVMGGYPEGQLMASAMQPAGLDINHIDMDIEARDEWGIIISENPTSDSASIYSYNIASGNTMTHLQTEGSYFSTLMGYNNNVAGILATTSSGYKLFLYSPAFDQWTQKESGPNSPSFTICRDFIYYRERNSNILSIFDGVTNQELDLGYNSGSDYIYPGDDFLVAYTSENKFVSYSSITRTSSEFEIDRYSYIRGDQSIWTSQKGNYDILTYNSISNSFIPLTLSDTQGLCKNINVGGKTALILTINGYLLAFDPYKNSGTAIENMTLDAIPPESFNLAQNYPNPFNPLTTINYSIPKQTYVELIITDILGKKVQTLVDKNVMPGVYKYEFDGSQLASGVYLYMLKTKEFTQVKKMLLVK